MTQTGAAGRRKQAVGELRDVHAAGYPNFLGMAGPHRFFHTPADDLTSTGPEILEPVGRAFADGVRKISARGMRAFKQSAIFLRI